MNLGLGLPQRGGVNLREDIPEVARTAEEAGFSSLWVYERLLFPTRPASGTQVMPGLPSFEYWQRSVSADPLAVLAVAAMATESIRLGSSVLVAALHSPVQLAKSLATIDQLSGGGRLLAGLGEGWMVDELRAVDSRPSERGARLDETLDVLAGAWGPDPVSYQGSHVLLEEVLLQPKPISPIPVLLGGGSTEAALERIARRADGWLPVGIPPAAAGRTWRYILEKAAGHGRETRAMTMIYRADVDLTDGPASPGRRPFTGDIAQVLDDVLACARAGVDELIIDLQIQDRFAGTKAMLDTAWNIKEKAAAGGI
jgi:probable F420-dependent oxidoreductase